MEKWNCRTFFGSGGGCCSGFLEERWLGIGMRTRPLKIDRLVDAIYTRTLAGLRAQPAFFCFGRKFCCLMPSLCARVGESRLSVVCKKKKKCEKKTTLRWNGGENKNPCSRQARVKRLRIMCFFSVLLFTSLFFLSYFLFLPRAVKKQPPRGLGRAKDAHRKKGCWQNDSLFHRYY